MWHFQTIDPAGTFSNTKYITFTGAGGKSSLIEYVAEKAVRKGKTVAVTTTTKIYAREPYTLFDDYVPHSEKKGDGRLKRIGKAREGEKLTALNFDEVLQLGKLFDMVLIEGDGAKNKPLKYPARYEPVIPPFSDHIVVVAGLDALWGMVKERVFRWELFEVATGVSPYAVIDHDLFLNLFSDLILLKGVDIGKCSIFLNKWDKLNERGEGQAIAKSIIEKTGCRRVVLSSVFNNLFYQVTRSEG